MSFPIYFPKRRSERGNTAAKLAALNEVLLAKEWCIETDTGRFKLGDGATAWNDLPYAGAGKIDLAGLADGDGLRWDAGAGRWVPTASSGPSSTDDLAEGAVNLYLSAEHLAALLNGGRITASADSSGALALVLDTGSLDGVNDQTGTTYTLVLSDANKDVRCTNASAIAVTIPPNSSVAFKVGTLLALSQGGAGAVTATAGSGVTLRAANGAATTAQYDARVLEKTDTDTWRVW